MVARSDHRPYVQDYRLTGAPFKSTCSRQSNYDLEPLGERDQILHHRARSCSACNNMQRCCRTLRGRTQQAQALVVGACASSCWRRSFGKSDTTRSASASELGTTTVRYRRQVAAGRVSARRPAMRPSRVPLTSSLTGSLAEPPTRLALIDGHHAGAVGRSRVKRDATTIEGREKATPIAAARQLDGQAQVWTLSARATVTAASEPCRLERQSGNAACRSCSPTCRRAVAVGIQAVHREGLSATSWVCYKLHIDPSDGGIPLSCILTSASVNDSQAADSSVG